MKRELARLEQKSRILEGRTEERESHFKESMSYAQEFIETLYDRPAFQGGEIDTKREINFNSPTELSEILEYIKSRVDKYGINPASPGHLGYIPGGGIYASAIGDFLAAISNRYSGLTFASPEAVKVENELIEWSRQIVGFPKGALGNMTSGGSIANLIAVITARDSYDISGVKVERSVVYMTQQTHHCVAKSLQIAGLGKCIIRRISVNSLFQMNCEALEKTIIKDKEDGLLPFMIIASCGSTDTGAIDPFNRIRKISKEHNIWMHIDAAYGGYFAMSETCSKEMEGLGKADSIVMDPHKTLFLPYGTGIVLIRDGKLLFNSFNSTANYLQDADLRQENLSPAHLSPELTKHFRGLRMWLPLKLHGSDVFKAALEEKALLTKYFYQEVQKLGFNVGPEPQLSVCIYRYRPNGTDNNAFNKSLVTEIQKDGRLFVSSTTIDNIYWIRIAIVCFRTHLETIDLYLNVLEEKTQELLRKGWA